MGSTPEVGSSKITTFEPPINAKATHNLLLIPSNSDCFELGVFSKKIPQMVLKEQVFSQILGFSH